MLFPVLLAVARVDRSLDLPPQARPRRQPAAVSTRDYWVPDQPTRLMAARQLSQETPGFLGQPLVARGHQFIGELPRAGACTHCDASSANAGLLFRSDPNRKLRLGMALRGSVVSFSQLPDSITRLTNLDSLGLAGNRLVALPSGMGSLKSLTAMSLHGNAIMSLPDTFGYLARLEVSWRPVAVRSLPPCLASDITGSFFHPPVDQGLHPLTRPTFPPLCSPCPSKATASPRSPARLETCPP